MLTAVRHWATIVSVKRGLPNFMRIQLPYIKAKLESWRDYNSRWPMRHAAVLLGFVATAILGGLSFVGADPRSQHDHPANPKAFVRASFVAPIVKIALPHSDPVASEPTPHGLQPGAPLDVLRVTSDFGMRLHPILGLVRMHEGVDFGAPEGSPVLAAADGVVTDAGPAGGYGNMLHIRHRGGWATGYAHLSAFAPGIGPGARVKSGEVIAFVGHTGLATGPHLHFEVSLNGVKLDPMSTPVTQIGAPGFFRWTALIGQARGIDLAYRIKGALSRDARGFKENPTIVVPVEPIATALEVHDQASHTDQASRITVNVVSAAQMQTSAQLTTAPRLSPDRQSFFKYSQPTDNHLPILGRGGAG